MNDRLKKLTIAGLAYEKAADLVKLMKREASELVADSIRVGTSTVKAIISNGEASDETIAAARDAFDDAAAISAAFGVEFYIPWDSEYDTTLSQEIENAVDMDEASEALEELIETLQEMEYTCAGWNQSNC